MADRPQVRLAWRVLDRLDYWLMQARLRLADAMYDPEPQRALIGDGGKVGIKAARTPC